MTLRKRRDTDKSPETVQAIGWWLAALVLFGGFVAGCSEPEGAPCDDDDDCFENEVCEAGYCTGADDSSADVGNGDDPDAESGGTSDDGGPGDDDAGDGTGDDADMGSEDAGSNGGEDAGEEKHCLTQVSACWGGDEPEVGRYDFHKGEDEDEENRTDELEGGYSCETDDDGNEFVPEVDFTTDEFRLCDGTEHYFRLEFEDCEESTYEVVFQLEPQISCPTDTMEKVADMTFQVYGPGASCEEMGTIDCPDVADDGTITTRFRVGPGSPAYASQWKPSIDIDDDFYLDYRVRLTIDEYEETSS